jgi:hypothetical protein
MSGERDVPGIVDPGCPSVIEMAASRRTVARDDDGRDVILRICGVNAGTQASVRFAGDANAFTRTRFDTKLSMRTGHLVPALGLVGKVCSSLYSHD